MAKFQRKTVLQLSDFLIDMTGATTKSTLAAVSWQRRFPRDSLWNISFKSCCETSVLISNGEWRMLSLKKKQNEELVPCFILLKANTIFSYVGFEHYSGAFGLAFVFLIPSRAAARLARGAAVQRERNQCGSGRWRFSYFARVIKYHSTLGGG